MIITNSNIEYKLFLKKLEKTINSNTNYISSI